MNKLGPAALLLATVAFGQATVRHVPNLPSWKELKFPPLREVKIPEPETFTLPNGIKVYLLENHELPLVSGVALVRTGNLFDPPDKKGLAGVTGGVLRTGGTKTKSGDEIDRELEDMAAGVESSIGESSATLNFSALKENARQTMGLWRDFLENAEFRQDKVELAKTQIRSAIARRNDEPSGIASREFASIVYGRNTPFGWQTEYADVDNIHREDLVAFYKRYYFPANIMVGVYGDFNSAEMKQTLTDLLGSWNYTQPSVPKFPAVSAKPEPGIYLAEKPDTTQTFFEIGHLGGLLSNKDYAALDVAAEILGSGFTSRLVRKIRTELGYAYSIGASWGAGYLNPGLFTIGGSTKSKSTTETIEVVLQELEKLRTAEVTPAELKTAKDAVLNGFVFNFDQPSKTLNRLMIYEYFGYPKDFIFRFQKGVEAVTRADVLRVAKEHLRPENLTIVAVGNPREFGSPLSTLKLPIHSIDLTIPQPKQAQTPVSAASAEKGRQLLQRAAEAIGGAAKLAALKDWSYSGDTALQMGGGSVQAKQQTRFLKPSYFRQDQQLPFGKVAVYSDGKSGWMVSPQGAMPLPAPVLQQVHGEVFRQLPTLLLSGQDQGRTVNDAGNGVVEISDKNGEQTRVAIDESSGMPKSQTYQSVAMGGAPQQVVETYSDWRDVDGIKVPFRISVEQGGQKAAELTITDYKFNTGLKPEELSQKP